MVVIYKVQLKMFHEKEKWQISMLSTYLLFFGLKNSLQRCNLKRKKRKHTYPSKNNRKHFHKNETDQQQPKQKNQQTKNTLNCLQVFYILLLLFYIHLCFVFFRGCLEVEALQ